MFSSSFGLCNTSIVKTPRQYSVETYERISDAAVVTACSTQQ
jgi:hypothetical protein